MFFEPCCRSSILLKHYCTALNIAENAKISESALKMTEYLWEFNPGVYWKEVIETQIEHLDCDEAQQALSKHQRTVPWSIWSKLSLHDCIVCWPKQCKLWIQTNMQEFQMKIEWSVKKNTKEESFKVDWTLSLFFWVKRREFYLRSV